MAGVALAKASAASRATPSSVGGRNSSGVNNKPRRLNRRPTLIRLDHVTSGIASPKPLSTGVSHQKNCGAKKNVSAPHTAPIKVGARRYRAVSCIPSLRLSRVCGFQATV